LLANAYANLLSLNVFGHDVVHYYPSWQFKLDEEGRWLNFILHGFLRSLPPATWAAVFLLSCWTLFFRIARSLSLDTPYSVLAASTILVCSPIAEQSLWPATNSPAVIVLLLTSLLVERGMSYILAYLFSGVLLFGSMQSFYFLVPLLFLRHFAHATESGARLWKMFSMHMAWWVIGAVIGTLVMFTVLWTQTGHFGIVVADWRRAHPVQGVADLIQNAGLVARAMLGQVSGLLTLSGAASYAFALVVALVALFRFRDILRQPQPLVLIAMVMASFFFFSIPLAPIIEHRNLVALGVAAVLLLQYLAGLSVAGKTVGTALLLVLCYNFSTHAQSYLGTHKRQTDFFYDKFQSLLPADPGSYTAIVLIGKMHPLAPGARIFNNAPRMHGIFFALGARDFKDCRRHQRAVCLREDKGRLVDTLPLGNGVVTLSLTKDNFAILQFEEYERKGRVVPRLYNTPAEPAEQSLAP